MFITNKPTLIRNMENIPCMSYHKSAIVRDCYLKPVTITKPPCQVSVWVQASWQKMKADIHLFASTYIMRDKTVDDDWTDFKEAVNLTIDRHTPTKIIKSQPKHTQWISVHVRRWLWKQQHLYKGAQISNSDDQWRQFKDHHKESVRMKIQTKYINEKVIRELTPNKTKLFLGFYEVHMCGSHMQSHAHPYLERSSSEPSPTKTPVTSHH